MQVEIDALGTPGRRPCRCFTPDGRHVLGTGLA